MKKLIAAPLAALALTAGLLGGTTTAASAAQCDNYGICKAPVVKVPGGPVESTPGKGPKQKLKLGAAGDAVPEGTYRLIVRRIGGERVFNKTKPLNENGAATISVPELPKGEYMLIMRFIPKKNTPWERVDTYRRLVVA